MIVQVRDIRMVTLTEEDLTTIREYFNQRLKAVVSEGLSREFETMTEDEQKAINDEFTTLCHLKEKFNGITYVAEGEK